MVETLALFRDRAYEKREAKKLKGAQRLVRVAYRDPEIPEYRDVMLTVYDFGLAVQEIPASEGRIVYGVTHVGTGYAVGRRFDYREQAVEMCYLLRDLDWHFERKNAVTDEHRRRTEQAYMDVREGSKRG